MSKLLEFSGGDDFCPGGYVCPSPMDSILFLSLGHQVDVYFPSRKRSRINAPFVFSGEKVEEKKQASIEVLPDECLFEIFRRLPVGGQERSACAGVSKRWLMLLSSICRDELSTIKSGEASEPEEGGNATAMQIEPIKSDKKDGFVQSNVSEAETEVLDNKEGDGFLSRCLDGKKATDVRLAAIAVGTASRGGLGKLSIRGNNSFRGVTDSGLKAIGRGCPSLKALSLWDISTISDEGLFEVASGCHQLEKLDLCQCPGITDKSLMAIAKSCPNLASVTIESCLKIGNESLQALGKYCPNLKFITVKNCPLVGDQGIASLFSSAGNHLMKVKLQTLNISDMSLAVIGHYGEALTDLALINLQNINERGFWVMGSGLGLKKLRSLVITACQGVTDLGIEAVGKGCPNVKQLCLRKCTFLSDNGMVSFVKAAVSLESLQLEECHRISQAGFFGILVHSAGKLKALAFENCFGMKDLAFGVPALPPCNSLKSLSIRNCNGFGDASLAVLSRLCPNVVHLNLGGLNGVTDYGLLPFVQSCDAGLVKVNLSGCVNVSDKTISALAKLHGETLELLNLNGCGCVTDASLAAVADFCSVLRELDVSKSRVSDFGIAALAGGSAIQISLQILSLSGCVLASDKCLPYLHKLGNNLKGLNIQQCVGISHRGVDLLVERLWWCDILS
ncbi:EIN3-binding F-box protein 1-like [Ipomoea triloba]|uniref:EIN3-binding F-box protein 1-like n=1 Tax=Ipomoea triloba TaxID=35885 RepID=UPI00125DA4C7|nr:EIN3-binding F-box protein 1-like [Ipomoea triloba]